VKDGTIIEMGAMGVGGCCGLELGRWSRGSKVELVAATCGKMGVNFFYEGAEKQQKRGFGGGAFCDVGGQKGLANVWAEAYSSTLFQHSAPSLCLAEGRR